MKQHSKQEKEKGGSPLTQARKRLLSGVIVSTKMEQTAVVLVNRLARHPKYKKTYRVSKKYKAHNPGNTYKEEENVVIQESRPLSKEKCWVIVGRAGERR